MTPSKLYTPDNCKLVGGLLKETLGEVFAPADSWAQCFFRDEPHAPQLLREALAAEGVYVFQSRTRLILTKGWRKILEVEWDKGNDRTARHALFAAVVEYL